ncbi:MAG: FHA domain-containing protein [Myxococcales bacterium]|nr:FHA domain-containing protein [Myxococcales bacterium]MDD9966594.1 FHA domain-containing protein [Myxococcales bacterium]
MGFSLRSGHRQYIIVGDVFVVGRGLDADLVLDDESVSRRHASFRIDDGVPIVCDLRSRNGTRVNGRPIAGAVQLKAGDEISIGSHNLELTHASPHTDPDALRATVPMVEGPGETGEVPAPVLAALSRREREVFALLSSGVPQREAAEKLGLSVKTIETYRTRIGQKLGLKSRAELIKYALQAGVLRPPEG